MSTIDPISKETLSALLDNAADDLELRRLLRDWGRLPDSERAELAATWSRYNLVHAALHGPVRPVTATLADRVRVAIASEPDHAEPEVVVGWQQSLARIAVAASVALAVIVGVQSALTTPATTELAGNTAGQAAEPTATDSPPALVADSVIDELLAEPIHLNAEQQGLVREYIGNIVIDPAEDAGFEHIEDSPLYRLVNDLRVQD